MKNVQYRELTEPEIARPLFAHFERRQEVTRCWRKIDGEWVIRDDPFIDQWGEAEYAFLVDCLRNTVRTGGVVYAAFAQGQLKGFASVEARPLGRKKNLRDLTSIHVSAECRGRGIGRELFRRAAGWARAHGGEKLYISAHSAVETQAFYRSMGCVEAQEVLPEHAEKEPFDCQLEYRL